MVLGMGDERMKQLFFLFILFVTVKIEEVIETEAMGGGHETVDRNICLQGTGGADTDDIERSEFGFDEAGIEIDIGEGVQFIDHDIDIIGADTGGEDGEAFFAHQAGMGHEFPVLSLHFNGIEVFADLFNAVGVPDGNDGSGDLFGAEVEVVNGTPFIDDQF